MKFKGKWSLYVIKLNLICDSHIFLYKTESKLWLIVTFNL